MLMIDFPQQTVTNSKRVTIFHHQFFTISYSYLEKQSMAYDDYSPSDGFVD